MGWRISGRCSSAASAAHVAVEPFHLFRYVDEQVFRYNHRGSKTEPVSDRERFSLVASQLAGKRLTYAELTGRVGETTGS